VNLGSAGDYYDLYEFTIPPNNYTYIVILATFQYNVTLASGQYDLRTDTLILIDDEPETAVYKRIQNIGSATASTQQFDEVVILRVITKKAGAAIKFQGLRGEASSGFARLLGLVTVGYY